MRPKVGQEYLIRRGAAELDARLVEITPKGGRFLLYFSPYSGGEWEREEMLMPTPSVDVVLHRLSLRLSRWMDERTLKKG